MKKYRKKPIVIEAERFNPISGEKATISTLEGDMIVCPGDWIIKGIEGEFYPCKDSIFQSTYEEVLEVTDGVD